MGALNKLATGVVVCALLGLSVGGAGAQGRPDGMRGQMPDGPPGKAAARADSTPPDVESLIPPDPWRLWHAQLLDARASLALVADQEPLFDAFLRELDDAQRLNSQRVLRAVHRVPPVASARTDIERDIRAEAADAADWAAALNDLATRWRALQVVLSPAQRGRVDGAYQLSRTATKEPPPMRR